VSAVPAARAEFLRATRWPAFRRVWTVATLQQAGYWFCSIAFQWLVAAKTSHDVLILSLLYGFMVGPILVFSVPAGVLADVRDRRTVLLWVQVAVLVISTGTATLVLLDRTPVWALIACAAAVGTAHSFSMPASQALVANSVPVADLRGAVVLQSIGVNLARIMGPALAGLIILAWGPPESLLVYGGLGLVSILVLWWLVPPAPPAPARVAGERFGARIRSGLSHARTHRPAAAALAIVATTSLFGASYLAQLPALAARLSDDPRAFVMLTSAGGIGSLVGVLSVGVRRNGPPSVTPSAIMLCLLGAVMVGLGFSRLLWLEVGLIAVAGGLQFGTMTHCASVIQQVVDDDHRGRVMSLYSLCWGGLLPVGGLVLGIGWHFAGALAALVASGSTAMAIAGYLLRPARSVVIGPERAVLQTD
jgi:MFS family permease